MNEQINTVFLTDRYEMFKLLRGNRAIEDGRVAKIMDSIEKVGFINTPIVCNEKFEVIDGQGRLEACKRKKLPVPYIVIPGLGIEECVNMNIYQSTWKMDDYINSGADRGIKAFVRLKEFINRSPYPIAITTWALYQTSMRNLLDVIKAGKLKLTDEQISLGSELIRFYANFDDIPTNKRSVFYAALGRCYMIPEIDNARLIAKVHAFPREFSALAAVTDTMDVIETVYNQHMRAGNHVYIKTLYFQSLGNAGLVSRLAVYTPEKSFNREGEENV